MVKRERVCLAKRQSNATLKPLCLEFELTNESILLLLRLESAMTKFGRGVDEFELDLFQVSSGRSNPQTLPDCEHSLFAAWQRTFDDDKVILDLSVVREATKRCDSLLGSVEFSSGRSLVFAIANSVDFVIDRSSVMISILTSTRHRVHDS